MPPEPKHMAVMSAFSYAIEGAFFEARKRQLDDLKAFTPDTRIKVVSCAIAASAHTIVRQTAKQLAAEAKTDERKLEKAMLDAIATCLEIVRDDAVQHDG